MWNKCSERGFSIVETMVAMALLAGAITLGMNFFGVKNKTRDTRTKQTMQRYIAIQITQHINGNLTTYPPISPPTASDKIVYVGCMNKDGVLLGNKFKFHVSSTFADDTPTTICELGSTVYEARFYWLNPLLDEVKINILTLSPGSNQSIATLNFKIFAK
jgi:prepilin-type N-terminal cleavage/methylation domain-containing protein